MKSVIYNVAILLGFFTLLSVPALIVCVAIGALDSEAVGGFQVCFWGFLIFFILHLILGGKAEDFKFWGSKTKS